jgi:NAD(P)-dependent dehydrogenase (short-subunit alcohol dehydrogenase family)
VTGRTSGIGLAVARQLAQSGWPVGVFGAHNDVAGREAAENLGAGHIYLHCDVSEETQVMSAMADVCERIGPVEVLVNNAGRGRHSVDAGGPHRS